MHDHHEKCCQRCNSCIDLHKAKTQTNPTRILKGCKFKRSIIETVQQKTQRTTEGLESI